MKVQERVSDCRLGQYTTSAQLGFTTIELIVVIVILGTLSLFVASRFPDRGGVSEFALQQRLQSALRNIQVKAVYDSSDAVCYRMIFDTSRNLIAPSTDRYLPVNQVESCSNVANLAAPVNLILSQQQLNEANVRIRATDSGVDIRYVEFNALGKPTTDAGQCNMSCQISLEGSVTTRICIESEGFVHACS